MPLLASVPSIALQSRFLSIRQLNQALVDCISLIDLGQAGVEDTLAFYVHACRGLIFNGIKMDIWKAVMDSYSGGSQPSIKVNRHKALNLLDRRGPIDKILKRSLFGQVFCVVFVFVFVYVFVYVLLLFNTYLIFRLCLN